MHRSIRDRLEELLAARGATAARVDLTKHLSSCVECSLEVESMRAQSDMLRGLRAPEQMEPAAGFYARVMQRIEERAKDSIWAVFIYSPFGKRLAYASLGIALTLGTYVITQETRDGHLGGDPVVARSLHYDAPVVGSRAQQRDAVLVNFVSHQGSLQ